MVAMTRPLSEKLRARRLEKSFHSCTCRGCVTCCYVQPGWMTPVEAERAINAGLASKLMRDWLPISAGRAYVLCPATAGHGGRDAPEPTQADLRHTEAGPIVIRGRCGFLNVKQRCAIHGSGFKPVQCRLSSCFGDRSPDKREIAAMWDSDHGRELFARWQHAVNAQVGVA
jgi:Fe-S-cluster containining protein